MRSEREPQLAHEITRRFALTFVNQRHVHPVQLSDGSYVTIKSPLRPSHIERHLRGDITLGAYALDAHSRASWLVLDADTSELHERLLDAYRLLHGVSIPAYLELSRRGSHLWLFFDKQPGRVARQVGRGLIARFNLKGIELYPKQDTLKTGPGSLVRLPFGIHQLTGKRYHFVKPDGSPLAPSIREQLALLGQPGHVPPEALAALAEEGQRQDAVRRAVTETRPFDVAPLPLQGTVSERIKRRISVKSFVGQYVDLNAQNRGYCPFHDDSRMSFGVNEQENFWHCFAGCGGGSVIDFWSRWRNLYGQDGSFTATVKDLASMLL